jgi:hypothetical protein
MSGKNHRFFFYQKSHNMTEKEDQKIPEHKEVVAELDAELEGLLQTPPLEGLTDQEVKARLLQFGTNCIN